MNVEVVPPNYFHHLHHAFLLMVIETFRIGSFLFQLITTRGKKTTYRHNILMVRLAQSRWRYTWLLLLF